MFRLSRFRGQTQRCGDLLQPFVGRRSLPDRVGVHGPLRRPRIRCEPSQRTSLLPQFVSPHVTESWYNCHELFVHHSWAGVNTIWDTVPKKHARKPDSPLRLLIRGAMRQHEIRHVGGPSGLAVRAGVSRNTIYAWEDGAFFAAAEMQKVAAVLELPVWRMVQEWERGKYGSAPPTEAGGARWTERLLTGMMALEHESGISDEDLDRARARADAWLSLEGTPTPLQPKSGAGQGPKDA